MEKTTRGGGDGGGGGSREIYLVRGANGFGRGTAARALEG